MTFEELVKKISPTLKRITHKLNGRHYFFDEDDLYQEALVHLWNNFERGLLDDKTDSYILQGCYFQLKNYLRTHKPRAKMISLDYLINQEENGGVGFVLKDRSSPIEDLHCKMLIEKIRNNGLTKREKEVFNLSQEGLTVRDIGKRLGTSHVTVVRLKKSLRKKIIKHIN